LRLSRTAETVLGLAVVAAIAATAFFVRQRQTVSSEIGGTGAVSTPADVVDVSRSDAVVEVGDVRVFVSAGPRPLVAFARNRFRFRAERAGAPVTLAGASVSFTMTMPMGDHRYTLRPSTGGWQEAEAVLPTCLSGHRRWFGRLDFQLEGQTRSARFAFDLTAGPHSSAGP
jgi:hypothetical protein